VILAESIDQVVFNAGEVGGKLMGKGSEKGSRRAAICVLAREKERSRQPFSIGRLLHFKPSHLFSYSERNSRLSDARGSIQPNKLILLLVA
jgi:hypothetical protein